LKRKISIFNPVYGYFKISPTDFPITCTPDYRFTFNGKESDSEVKGEGNSLDFGARIYDSRLGRFWTIDPISFKLPSLSSYQFAGNSSIRYVDVNGEGPGDPVYTNIKGKGNVVIYLVDPGKSFSEPLLNNNDTWDVIAVNNIANAAKILNQVYSTTNKVQNLAIRTHGDYKGAIHLTSTNKQETPKRKWMDSEDFEKPENPFQFEQIETFIDIFKTLNDGSTILLTVCGLGKGNVPEKLLSIANTSSGASNLIFLSNMEITNATFDLKFSLDVQFVFNEELSTMHSWKQTTMLTENKFINFPVVNYTPIIYEDKAGISWSKNQIQQESNGK
jgi:RHS repeat-associated protein